MGTRKQGEPPPKDKLTARQRQALERRAHILEVASRLFVAQGFAGTSTRQIAQEAGIAEGLIFHYFPDKAVLFAAS
jgi:AcrR family transcriptional regulator